MAALAYPGRRGIQLGKQTCMRHCEGAMRALARHGGVDIAGSPRFPPSSGPFTALLGLLARLRTHLSHPSRQRAPHHPQIAQREQRLQLRRVLGQSPVAHFHMPELALDHPKRVLHLGAHTRIQELALARAPRGFWLNARLSCFIARIVQFTPA